MYKALRVPITLLHQKVYDTSVRLDKRVALKPLVKPEVNKNSDFFYNTTLRRNFYKKNDILHCRTCHNPCPRVQDRTDHYLGTCRDALSWVMIRLLAERTCSVCHKRIDYGKVTGIQAVDSLPVCSIKCADAWDGGNPDAFVDQLVKYYVTRVD